MDGSEWKSSRENDDPHANNPLCSAIQRSRCSFERHAHTNSATGRDAQRTVRGVEPQALRDNQGFTEAIRLDPTLTTAYVNRRNAYANKHELEKGAVPFVRCAKIGPVPK